MPAVAAKTRHVASVAVRAPRHIAIIMDGNSRWARRNGVPQLAGHRAGIDAIRRVLSACRDHKVEVLTLFAFSSENWQRPESEVKGLMSLFLRYLQNESRELNESGIRLEVIGNRERFSKRLRRAIDDAEELTAGNDRFTLVIAADYGGRWDIADAARRLAIRARDGQIDPELIDVESLSREVCLAAHPPPDLLIRTGGDHRISNFLLWQLAYSELYFTETYWPDFDAEQLAHAVEDYGLRERRFGRRDEQHESAPC